MPQYILMQPMPICIYNIDLVCSFIQRQLRMSDSFMKLESISYRSKGLVINCHKSFLGKRKSQEKR